MSSMESSTGSTKHADSCCKSLPAFIRVGELGMNFRLVISSAKSLRHFSKATWACSPSEKRYSASAMLSATRWNISIGCSAGSPCSSFLR